MKNIWQERDWQPMLLKEITKPFNSADYIFELKFDGIRAIIFVSPTHLQILSRNQKDLTPLFPELQSLKKLVHTNTIFDGEIVVFQNGKPSFHEIQKRLHVKNTSRIKTMSIHNPVLFVAFDILYEKEDRTSENLIQRKKRLNKYQNTNYFVKPKMIEQEGIKLFQNVKKLKLEGIVAKKKDSIYHINQRTDDFIKIKNLKQETFWIGGYEKKKNNLLSLALGEKFDNNLHYVGNVSISKKASIYHKILKMKPAKNYFKDYQKEIIYVKPTLTCQITYLEKNENHHLRHPILKEDKEGM